jgi:hypothetical protein
MVNEEYRRVNMVDALSTYVLIWNIKIQIHPTHFKKGRGKKESNGGKEPNWGTLHAYMEMS